MPKPFLCRPDQLPDCLAVGRPPPPPFHRIKVKDGDKRSNAKETRPDTRPISVAGGWAGAEMRVLPCFDSSVTDQPTNQPTDQPTNQPTGGRTKPLIVRD